MKKSLLLLFLGLTVFLFNSCKKSSPDVTPVPFNSISFKVGGADQTGLTGPSIVFSSKNNFIAVAGQLNNGGYILINIYQPQIGTFNLPDPADLTKRYTYQYNNISYRPDGAAAVFLNDISGTITITALSATAVTGTFQVSCTDPAAATPTTKVLTEGKFSGIIYVDNTN